MNKVYLIFEQKPVVYTYRVYAKNVNEALNKFRSGGDYEEVGLDPGTGGKHDITIRELDETESTCSQCSEKYSPENVGDYLCPNCRDAY